MCVCVCVCVCPQVSYHVHGIAPLPPLGDAAHGDAEDEAAEDARAGDGGGGGGARAAAAVVGYSGETQVRGSFTTVLLSDRWLF